MRTVFIIYAAIAALFSGGCGLLLFSFESSLAGHTIVSTTDKFIFVALCANLLMAFLAYFNSERAGAALVGVAILYAAAASYFLFVAPDNDLRDLAGVLAIVLTVKVVTALLLGLSFMRTPQRPSA